MNCILENDYLKVEVSDLGARIIRLINKKTNHDLIMGQDDETFLKYANLYIGAAVGRNCNLIVGSRFNLNNKTYSLTANAGNNQLHGGFDSFSFVRWHTQTSPQQVVFSQTFSDGLDGYPGNMKVDITYCLQDNKLLVYFDAVCDRDCLFNPTLHTYFNMGDFSFENVQLKIETSLCGEVDKENQPLESCFEVRNTPYDFTDFAFVKKQIKPLPNGIDTNYVFENMNEKLLCILKTETDQLRIYSDLPGLEMYTCNDFDRIEGKDSEEYGFRCGVALEPDYFPNSINFDRYLKPIIRANEPCRHQIIYQID